MPADVRSRALACVRSGRVRVLSALTVPGAERPCHVEAHVASSRSGADGFGHRVRLDAGAWECSCRAKECAHRAAVQLVTGWPTAAAPTPTTPKGSR